MLDKWFDSINRQILLLEQKNKNIIPFFLLDFVKKKFAFDDVSSLQEIIQAIIFIEQEITVASLSTKVVQAFFGKVPFQLMVSKLKQYQNRKGYKHLSLFESHKNLLSLLEVFKIQIPVKAVEKNKVIIPNTKAARDVFMTIHTILIKQANILYEKAYNASMGHIKTYSIADLQESTVFNIFEVESLQPQLNDKATIFPDICRDGVLFNNEVWMYRDNEHNTLEKVKKRLVKFCGEEQDPNSIMEKNGCADKIFHFGGQNLVGVLCSEFVATTQYGLNDVTVKIHLSWSYINWRHDKNNHEIYADISTTILDCMIDDKNVDQNDDQSLYFMSSDGESFISVNNLNRTYSEMNLSRTSSEMNLSGTSSERNLSRTSSKRNLNRAVSEKSLNRAVSEKSLENSENMEHISNQLKVEKANKIINRIPVAKITAKIAIIQREDGAKQLKVVAYNCHYYPAELSCRTEYEQKMQEEPEPIVERISFGV